MQPELQFIISNTILILGSSRVDYLQSTAEAIANWDYLIKLSLKHRVKQILYTQILTASTEIPNSFTSQVRSDFHKNLAAILRRTNETFHVLERLRDFRLEAMPFKGQILSFMAYGDTTLRQAGDIDLLIKRENLSAVENALILSGYKRVTEDTVAQARRFLQVDCQHVYYNSEKDIILDLHWEFAPSYWGIKLNTNGLWKRAQPLLVEDTWIEVFAPEDTMLVLTLNAAKDLYSCLIRLYDIAGFIQRHPQLDWPVLLTRAQAHGLSRMLKVSLWLVHDLLGTPLPPEVLNSLKTDKTALRVAQTARNWLFEQKPITGSISDMIRPACLMQSRWAQIKFYFRLGLTPTLEDWKIVELPEGLAFGYYLLRPLRLAKKYLFAHK